MRLQLRSEIRVNKEGQMRNLVKAMLIAPLWLLMVPAWTQAVEVRPREMATARQWVEKSFTGETPHVPFSFVYGGQRSAGLLKNWEFKQESRRLDAQGSEHTLSYRDPKTGLVVRCVAVEYRDYPTVEWTLYFKNTGVGDTPILENIQALDTRLERSEKGEFLLHHFAGSSARQNDYQPFEASMRRGVKKRFSSVGGRPSNGDFPYFNVEWPGQGVIIVVGWPGQWAAQYSRDRGNGLQVQAGQELTHLKLLPGEEIRTPRIVMQFWKGDWIRAQNIWRRWMLAHNLLKIEGNLSVGQFAGASCPYYGPFVGNNEENQKLFIDRFVEEGLKLDYWWIDAGWYPNNGTWQNTGTWEFDAKRFPGGLRAVADYIHSKAGKLIVWFEPERVTPGSWLYDKRPEWLLTPPPNPGDQAYSKDTRLLNLGNPDALKWLTDHVDELITEQGIDLYRQDFNMDPLYYWRANDAADRQGITEMRYVTGYLSYWDELRRRHPGMPIDTCASGGRRNDVETLRRAVPLTRSDYLYEPVGQQAHTYGMAFWIPYFGTITDRIDPYSFRSQMCPSLQSHWDVRRKDIDYKRLGELVNQWREISPYYLGDYYPLTSYSTANDTWMAWQFDRPDLGEGMVQIFRRAESPYEAAHFKLKGLDPNPRYRVNNLDSPGSEEMTGRELREEGISVILTGQPEAAIFVYKRLEARQP